MSTGLSKIEGIIVDLIGDPAQEIEDVLVTLINRLSIDSMSDIHLDNIGKIVGLNRQGYPDVKYRLFLKGKKSVNSSEGSIEEMITIIGLLTNSAAVQLSEIYPATITFYATTAIDAADLDLVHQMIQDALGAAVELGHHGTIPTDDRFLIGGDATVGPYVPVIDSDTGLGSDYSGSPDYATYLASATGGKIYAYDYAG